MANKNDLLPTHKMCQKKIAGRKIRVPPLDHHQIRSLSPDMARCPYHIKRIRRMKHILRIRYLKTVIAIIPLFLVKEEFRILHLIRDHLYIITLCQLPIHESRIVGYPALIWIDRSDQDNFIAHRCIIPFCIQNTPLIAPISTIEYFPTA